MNEGSVYQRKDKRWVAQWKDSQSKALYLYRKTKSEARAALRQVLMDRDEGIVPVGKLTLNDLLDSWLEDMDGTVSRRTMVHRENIFRVHIKPTNGTQRVSSLTDKDFQRLYRTKVYEGVAAGTLKCVHALLKRLGMPFAANTLATAHYPM